MRKTTAKIAIVTLLAPTMINVQSVWAIEEEGEKSLEVAQVQTPETEDLSSKANASGLDDTELTSEIIEVEQDASEEEKTKKINSDIQEENRSEGETKEQIYWGTSPVHFDENEGVLTVEAGILDSSERPVPFNQVKKIVFEKGVFFPENSSNLFTCPEGTPVESIEGLTNVNTSQVKRMDGMFRGCSKLKSLDLSNFNTSQVMRMDEMFLFCYSLSSIDLSNFDTARVTKMQDMFGSTSSLEALDLSSFDTKNVTNMRDMFYRCSSLKVLDLSNFDTEKVTDMSKMFSGCSNLKILDLSSFITNDKTSTAMFLQDINPLELILGPGIVDIFASSLADPPQNEGYTGKWINVGPGTTNNPQGTNVWNKYEFVNTFNGVEHADTYVWQKLDDILVEGQVSIKYVDEFRNEIHSPQTISGSVGESYDATTSNYKLNIEGYQLDETRLPDNAIGQLTEETQIVTYVYTKNPEAGKDVIVKYVDTEGNKISEDVVKSGNIGEDYTTEQKEITGYTFKEVQGDASGKFTDQAQTVTYVYIKNPEAGSDVTAKYVDTEGNSISEDVVKSGNIGEDYTTEQREITGYTFKEVQGDASGKFTDQAQTVTYIYGQNDETVPGEETDTSKEIESSTEKQTSDTSSVSQRSDISNSGSKYLPTTGEKATVGLSFAGLSALILAGYYYFKDKK